MRRSTRFRSWATLGTTVAVAVLALLVVPELVGSRDSQAKVEAWVATHAFALPTTLPELQAIPSPFRAALARALSPEVKASLWRAQLTALARDRSLLPTQRRHVAEMLSLVRPDVYAALASGAIPPEVRRGRALCGEVPALFPSPEHRAMLKELGAGSPSFRVTAKNWELVRLYLSDRIRDALTLSAREETCNCNTTSSCNRCKWTGCSCSGSCEPTYLFCGCSGFMPCDGWCITGDPD
jgi:hypothetical protein